MQCTAEALIDYKVRRCSKDHSHRNTIGERRHHGDGFLWHAHGTGIKSEPCPCGCAQAVEQAS